MVHTNGSTLVPVKIVGSSSYGRYPFISAERTYNMFISKSGDGKEMLVNFAGFFRSVALGGSTTEGRGIFHSVRGGFLLVVTGSSVYRIDSVASAPIFLFSLGSSTGPAVMDENLASQIGIVAGGEMWIYNYTLNVFGQPATVLSNTNLIPNYITYQNTQFIIGNAKETAAGSQWYVYTPENPVTTGYELSNPTTLTLQTKPDFAIAALRIPGAGNNLLVFGSTVAEIWENVGGLQVYQRQSNINIDYGCVSVSTIAASDLIICWLSINEKSSPSIMAMQGSRAERISTDGIDNLLDSVRHPEQSTAFFYRQDGHLFYQLTFFNPNDNFTITYDFTLGKFYDLTDQKFNFHPARQIAYFQGQTYFVNINNGDLYEMGSDITSYSITDQSEFEIPRIRTCDTFRLPTPDRFITELFTFTIENGTDPRATFSEQCFGYIITEEGDIIYTEDDESMLLEGGFCQVYRPRIDVRLSYDGGNTFGNAVQYEMKGIGHTRNQPRFNRLGASNQLTIQMQFWSFWRFIVDNGYIEVRS